MVTIRVLSPLLIWKYFPAAILQPKIKDFGIRSTSDAMKVHHRVWSRLATTIPHPSRGWGVDSSCLRLAIPGQYSQSNHHESILVHRCHQVIVNVSSRNSPFSINSTASPSMIPRTKQFPTSLCCLISQGRRRNGSSDPNKTQHLSPTVVIAGPIP